MIGFGVQTSWQVPTLDDAVVTNRAICTITVDTAEIKAHKIRLRLKTKAQETTQAHPTLYSQEVSLIATDPNPDYV